MDPQFQAEVQKLLKHEISDTERYSGTKTRSIPGANLGCSTISWKKPHHVVPIVKTEREKQQEKDGVLLDSTQEIRNIPELHHVREEYFNLKSLNQIAQENLKCKQAHLLSLQEQVRGKVEQLRQEETLRVKRHNHVQTLIDIKRKARVLKLKIHLYGKNIGVIEKRRESLREDHKIQEEKLKNTEDTNNLEFINQRNYLRVEVQEFKTKEKDFRLNISKYEISNQETIKWEELTGRELQLKTDVEALKHTMQELMNEFKSEKEKIIASHAHEIERLEAENKEMLQEIGRIESNLREKNQTMLQFMNHTKQVDYSNYSSLEEQSSGATRIVFDQPKIVSVEYGNMDTLTNRRIRLNRIAENEIHKLVNDGGTVHATANQRGSVPESGERTEVFNIEIKGNKDLKSNLISFNEYGENIEGYKNERFPYITENNQEKRDRTVESFEDETSEAKSCEANMRDTSGESNLGTNEDLEWKIVATNVKASGKLSNVSHDKESENDISKMSFNSADHHIRSKLNLHSSCQPQTTNTDLDDPMNSSNQTLKQINTVQSVVHVFKKPNIIQTGSHCVSSGQICSSESQNSIERDMQKELQQYVELNTDRNNVNTNLERGFISNVEVRFAPENNLCTQRFQTPSSFMQRSGTPHLQRSTTPNSHRDTKPLLQSPSTLQRSITPNLQRSSTPHSCRNSKPHSQTPSTLQRSVTPHLQRSSTPNSLTDTMPKYQTLSTLQRTITPNLQRSSTPNSHRDTMPKYQTPPTLQRSVTPTHRETNPHLQSAFSNQKRSYKPEDHRSATPPLRPSSTPHTSERNTAISKSYFRGNYSPRVSPSILFPRDTEQAAKACNNDFVRLGESPMEVQQWHTTNQAQSNNMNTNKNYGNSRELVPNRNMVHIRPQKDGHHLTDGNFKIRTQLSFKLCNTIVPRELNSGKIVLKNTLSSDRISKENNNKVHQFKDSLIERENKTTRQKSNAGQNFKIRGDIRFNIQQTNVMDINNTAHDLNIMQITHENEVPKALSTTTNERNAIATQPYSLVRRINDKLQDKGNENNVQNISNTENEVENNYNVTHSQKYTNKIDDPHSSVQNTSDSVNDGNDHNKGQKEIERKIDEQNETSQAGLNKESKKEPNNPDTKNINSFDNKLKQFLLGKQNSMATSISSMKLVNKPREILLKKKPGTTHLKRVKNVKFNSSLNQVYEASPLHETGKRKSETKEDKPKKRRSRKLFSLEDED